jgi:hypothetical protein
VRVRDVVAEYSERSLNSALPPIGDAESVVRDVLDRVAGVGPLMPAGCVTSDARSGQSSRQRLT